MRLNKFICKCTEYDLVEANALITRKRVQVNDRIITDVSHQAHKNNIVRLDGKGLTARCSRYFVLNKPVGMVCSNIDEVYPSVLNLIDVSHKIELHIAGRLDMDTTGLVLVTDDGHWSFNLTSPMTRCEKVYKVELTRPISLNAIPLFLEGVLLPGEKKKTLPAKLDIVNSHSVFLTLTEGRYHQVKRMFAFIGNRVKSLHRHKIGSLELDVVSGDWRYLTQSEVDALSPDKL